MNRDRIEKMKEGALAGIKMGGMLFILGTLLSTAVDSQLFTKAFTENPVETIETLGLALAIYTTSLAGIGAVFKGLMEQKVDK